MGLGCLGLQVGAGDTVCEDLGASVQDPAIGRAVCDSSSIVWLLHVRCPPCCGASTACLFAPLCRTTLSSRWQVTVLTWC
jgi:hypothetical protein